MILKLSQTTFNHLGGNAMQKNDIILIHGTDYKAMTKRILEHADLAGQIGSRETLVALKPNLVNDTPPSHGATTHSELVEGTLEYLLDHGFHRLMVMESSWVGGHTPDALRATGLDRICRSLGVPFADLQKDTWKEYNAEGMRLSVCDQAMSAGFVINLPVLKGHCQTTVTCALKNNKGVIPNIEKRRFHTLGLHKPIAHLNTIVRNDFILVDNICGDLDFEEGGNPVEMNRILGFRDPVLCDAFVCEAMGYLPSNVRYITLAEELGVGSTDLSSANRIYLNQPKDSSSWIRPSRRVRELAAYTDPSDACSACYGSLIHALDRLKESGKLHRKLPKIGIGQGWQGKTGKIGIGRCTSCFHKNLQGCPPSAAQILEFLLANWSRS